MRWVLVLVGLTACYPQLSDHDVRGPDGHISRLVKCTRHQDCFARATKVCPRGYTDAYELKNPHEMLIQCSDGSLDVPRPKKPVDRSTW